MMARLVLLLLHDFPEPGKFPLHGGSSPMAATPGGEWSDTYVRSIHEGKGL